MPRWSITMALAAMMAAAGCSEVQVATPKTAAEAKGEKHSHFQPMPMITYYEPIQNLGPNGAPTVPAAIDRREVDLGAR